MIFANINSRTHQIVLVSIPRDLYYNNRKINSYYSLYGMEELKRVLSKITGFQIDKYILIDMYAFIEVIDLIGGVDVHLDQPVIDPTYKVLDGGVWSTLYYRAGDHHLSGKQALRLARTRHTSSDFARSNRQQMILKALQKKAQLFGLGDAGKLTEIAKTILSKTETDLSLTEAIPAYFRYQGFAIEGGNVLSTENVLTSKYTGELKANECLSKAVNKVQTDEIGSDKIAVKENCLKDKGEYILLPRNNNWNLIRWYFHQLIK